MEGSKLLGQLDVVRVVVLYVAASKSNAITILCIIIAL